MLLTNTIMVTRENGPRPAGKPDECFYCNQPIGQPHKDDCVCRRKTVIVTVMTELLLTMPADWDEDQIHFHLNSSSSCADNTITYLVKQFQRMEKVEEIDPDNSHCVCGITECEFDRDASEEDHVLFAYGISSDQDVT